MALALVAVLAATGLAARQLVGEGPSVTKSSKNPHPIVKVSGNVARPLTPGTSQRLNLRISNRSKRRMVVTKLTISLTVDAAHRRAGCSRARSFRVTPIRRRNYPITLPARRARTLRVLGVRRVPRLRMLNLATNQDACKGARLRLRYSAKVRPWRPIHAR